MNDALYVIEVEPEVRAWLQLLPPSLDGIQTRVTYWITDDRRVVLLTVFHRTRAHEEAQINRAVLAKKECEAEHGPAHTDFTREEGDQ
ncbi:hypothetical protein ACWGLG_25385 [Streptomyces antimycoticus]